MSAGLRALVLLTDAFGGIGGIAKFNRDFLQALDECPFIERVYALPRKIPEPIDESIPEIVVYDRKAASGKLSFLLRAAAHAWRDSPIDVVICGHLHLLPAAWVVARARRARLILIIHGLEAWMPSRHLLANLAAARVDAFIAVSKYSAQRFIKWSKLPMDKAFIMPNCVDLTRFAPQVRNAALVKRYGLQSSRVILTVGRLVSEDRYKGFDQVIEILPQLLTRFPNLKYLIVGDGIDRPRLTAKVEELGVSAHVIFAGYVHENEKVAHYNLADVYAMPSRGEGFGIVLLEAIACGIPVIGSRADGSREALLDGRLGRLVDPQRPDELLKAITAILENPVSCQCIDEIKTFSVQNFRARVTDWCRQQIITCGAHFQPSMTLRFPR